MCLSGDQCYRYCDHCDNEEHCDDGSDEGGTCKARFVFFMLSKSIEYIVYFVPILMLLFIGSLVVLLVCVRVRGCAARNFGIPWTATTSTSGASVGLHRTHQIQIQTGEMVIMTNID